MPIYEYKCNDCENRFEIFYKKDDHIKCYECGSENLKKLVSSFAIKIAGTHFVGEGKKKNATL